LNSNKSEDGDGSRHFKCNLSTLYAYLARHSIDYRNFEI